MNSLHSSKAEASRSPARPVIAIDGLAGSGKSTLAKLLAKRLGFQHLHSGGLYRGVALAAVQSGIAVNDIQALTKIASSGRVVLGAGTEGETRVILDGVDVTGELATPEISEFTSLISAHPSVRQALLTLQRDAFPGRGLVAEGRDMGTVVFPDAVVKFFIEAPTEIRIGRRLAQLGLTGDGSEEGRNLLKRQIEMEIEERDARDRSRVVAPTVAAADAVVVDNGGAALTAVLETMYSAASLRLAKSRRGE